MRIVNGYNYNYGYVDATQPIQNRLSYREQQMNQFQNQQWPNFNVQQNNSMMLKGRPVSSSEEAKASMIDLDGSVFVFPDFGNGKIYTKQINLDGTATMKMYALEKPQAEPKSALSVKEDDNSELSKLLGTIDVMQQDIVKLNQQISELQNKKGGYR